MKKRSLIRVPSRLKVTSAYTGEHCPQTGWWTHATNADRGEQTFVMEGNVMPAVKGLPMLWMLADDGV